LLLKLIVIALVVPPISLVFLGLLGLMVRRRHRRIGRVMVWFGLLGLLILAIPVVGRSLLVTLEDGLPLSPPPDQPPQAIVVLGGDVERGGGEAPVQQVGGVSLERVRTAALLQRRTGLPLLVSGGSIAAHEAPVAEVMADSLANDFQVPFRWIERESLDTWGNAHRSAAILREQGIRSIYLVTNAWHMRRAIMAFRDTGITITAAPTLLESTSPLPMDFVPNTSGWRASYFAIHEWIGCAFYALR
jgi:uncharacterized SAM-binding protein YcdF (DUF218 family)